MPAEPNLDLAAAAHAVVGQVLRTPLVRCAVLDPVAGAPVFLKLESLQHTGSFKVRGAAVRMAALSPEERRVGVVACSSGNHGRAVAFVARRLSVPATICVPDWVDPLKLDAIRRSGATVELAGATYDQAELRALTLSEEKGLTFVHPFDDALVVAGQGTVALEILDDLPDVGRIVLPLSGGGLVAGAAYAVRARASRAGITAVSATNASVMLRSLEAGHPLEMTEEATLASALAGGIGIHNRVTFQLVRDLVRDHIEVTEDEIREAIRFAATDLRLVVEGGGAVGLAAALAGRLRPETLAPVPDTLPPSTKPSSWTEQPLVIVVSGGNLDPRRLAELLKA